MRKAGRVASNHANARATISATSDLFNLAVIETCRCGPLVLYIDFCKVSASSTPCNKRSGKNGCVYFMRKIGHGHDNQPTNTTGNSPTRGTF